jgi:nitrogen fixation/metabolism regulation signal transduction histidine kinase
MKQDLFVNLGGGVLLIIAGALLTVLLTRRIVGPVETLTAMAGRIAAGDLESNVRINTGDELQVLGESFNRMSESLRQSNAQLAEYQGNLEAMVRRRTEELQKAASQAQQLAQRDVLTGLANRACSTAGCICAAQAERRGDVVVAVSTSRTSTPSTGPTGETGDASSGGRLAAERQRARRRHRSDRCRRSCW